MKHLVILVACYLIAAPLTERISLDLRLTHWWDIATYLFLIFGAAIWVVIFFAAGIAVAIIKEVWK